MNIDSDIDTETAHRSTRATLMELDPKTDTTNWPILASGQAYKPGFDMIHHAMNNRGRRQVGTALATAIKFASVISNFMGQLIKPLVHTIQARN